LISLNEEKMNEMMGEIVKPIEFVRAFIHPGFPTSGY
jgi:hypothetical protein